MQIKKRTFTLLLGILVTSVLTSSLIWQLSYRQGIKLAASTGAGDLNLATDRLQFQLRRYRELAVLIVDHPKLSALLEAPRATNLSLEAQEILMRSADKTGATNLAYYDVNGKLLSSAHQVIVQGSVLSQLLNRAVDGALGSSSGYNLNGKRQYYFASPHFAKSGKVKAVLLVVVDVDRLEFEWRGTVPTVFFMDGKEQVFISNRSELIGWTREPNDIGLHPPTGDFPKFESTTISGKEIWITNWGPYVPKTSLHLTKDLAVIGMRAEILVDLGPAAKIANLQAAIAAVLVLFLGTLILVTVQRRRVLADTNTQLELKVAEKTADLRAAQTELVQAGKLSALGKMSAGISHELNHPLMAIQQYSENAGRFLQINDNEKAHNNLSEIQKLSQRMARIIKNLRAFARNEHEPMGRVDVLDVITAALSLTRTRIDQTQTELITDLPSAPVYVNAGEVRLSQVVVNLISNALDAMEESKERKLSIRVSVRTQVEIHVTDTGPGIDDPEKMFDPFYTTKSVDKGEGLGLGLSISYGLVQSFGGDIKGKNSSTGAHMVVTLDKRNNDEH